MNEAETGAELIDPKRNYSDCGMVEDLKILREHPITAGRIQAGGGRGK
jgi:type I restriction enzyme R subunit